MSKKIKYSRRLVMKGLLGLTLLIPNAERLNDIAKDYQSMSEMIFSDKPSFEEIVNGLHELEQFLRSIR